MAIYLLILMGIISISNIYYLLGLLVVLASFAGGQFLTISRKTILSILFFNLIISLSYAISSIIKGEKWVGYVLLINLRVFDATFFTFYFTKKINLFKALEFSRTLSFLLIIAYGQIINYKRIVQNFRQAFKSRNFKSLKNKEGYNFIKSVFFSLFQTSIHSSNEISLSMKSRCFNVDKS